MKRFLESNGILILNILSIILLLALPFLLYLDFKALHEEWRIHSVNGDIYAGNGNWFSTKILICENYDYSNCPEGCVICPPCEVCSSVSCQLEEDCKSRGFNSTWWEEVSPETKKDLEMEVTNGKN